MRATLRTVAFRGTRTFLQPLVEPALDLFGPGIGMKAAQPLPLEDDAGVPQIHGETETFERRRLSGHAISLPPLAKQAVAMTQPRSVLVDVGA